MNRTFILREIENIREETNNFTGDEFKDFSYGNICKDASDLDFVNIGDYELLFFYKKLIDRWNPSFSESGVSKCVCGGNAEVNCSHTGLNNCGYAYVKCNTCGLEMRQNSEELVYDDFTLDTLRDVVIKSWNKTMNCK